MSTSTSSSNLTDTTLNITTTAATALVNATTVKLNFMPQMSAAAAPIDPLSHVGDGIFLQTKTAQGLAGIFVWAALFITCQQVGGGLLIFPIPSIFWVFFWCQLEFMCFFYFPNTFSNHFCVLCFLRRSISIYVGIQIPKNNVGLYAFYLLYPYMQHIPGLVCYSLIPIMFMCTFSLYEIVMKVRNRTQLFRRNFSIKGGITKMLFLNYEF